MKSEDADRLVEVAIEVKRRLYDGYSVDELLCNPDDAKDLCVQVRRRTGTRAKDALILHALLNARKRSRVK